MLTQLVLITLLIIGAAYFAMSEIALAGSRKVRLERMAEEGDHRARLVLNLKENPGYFFSVVQVGINDMFQLRQKADNNCAYEISENDILEIIDLSHDFIKAILNLVK